MFGSGFEEEEIDEEPRFFLGKEHSFGKNVIGFGR